MKKEKSLNPEQMKEIFDWLNSEIAKLNKAINRQQANGNYSRAANAEGARDACFRCVRKLTGEDE